MLRRKTLVVLTIGLLSVLLSACDPLFKADAERIGVTVSASGEIGVVILLCPGEELREVALSELVSDGSKSVWKVRPTTALDQSVALTMWVSDQAPPGFEDVLPLRTEIDQAADLLAEFSSVTSDGDPAGAAREFRIENLEPGMIFTRGGSKATPDAWEETAKTSC